MIINFEVAGEPQGKRRARFFKAGHFIKSYSDPATVNYETYIREMFCIAYPGFIPLKSQLAVELKTFCGIPKTVSKHKRAMMESGKIRPAKRPELDNIAKVFLDALTGLAFKNDSQVVTLFIDKKYSERPRVEIEIKEEKSQCSTRK